MLSRAPLVPMGDLVTCTITSSPIFTFRRESEFAAAASAGISPAYR